MLASIKRWGIIAIIPLIVSSCATTKYAETPEQYAARFNVKPEFSCDSVKISGISFDGLTLKIDASIKNHYPVKIKLEKINLQIKAQSALIYSGVVDLPMNIKKESDEDASFEVVVSYADILRGIKNYAQMDEMQCDFAGDATFTLPKVSRAPSLPETETIGFDDPHPVMTVLPALVVKKVSMYFPTSKDVQNALKQAGQNLDILTMARLIKAVADNKWDDFFQAVSASDLKLDFYPIINVEFQNKTKTTVNFTSLNYQLSLNDVSVMSGTTSDVSLVNKTSVFNLVSQVSSSDFTEAIIKAITTRSADFHLTGEVELLFPGSSDVVRMAIDQKGAAKIQQSASKPEIPADSTPTEAPHGF